MHSGHSLRLSTFGKDMFTGIIEEKGRIQAAEPTDGGRKLVVACSFADELRVDQSVAVNGVCLTVTAVGDGVFEATAAGETLSKTTLGALAPGAPVNLERALKPTHRLDGHMVQGHVDGTGEIVSVARRPDRFLCRIAYDPACAHLLVSAGSIAVDGISFTVARLDETTFTVSVIPHTRTLTNAGAWEAGDRVNLEYDLIGKYIARGMEAGRSG